MTKENITSAIQAFKEKLIQLHCALLRYAVHALSFFESNPWKKLWALAAAGTHAEAVMKGYGAPF